LKLGLVRSAEWSDAVCAVMWVDGRDSWRLVRWLPRHMSVKNNCIVDTVRNIDHRLYPGCVVVVRKNGTVEVL